MRKMTVATLVVLLIVSTVAMTSAQDRVPQLMGGAGHSGVTAAPDAITPDSILWDQAESTVDLSAYVDQDFEAAFDAYDMFVADDFVNTQSWTLNNIWVPGNTWNPGGDLTAANTLNWQIYADAGGVPAGDPWSGGAYWSLSLAPTDPQVQLLAGYSGYLTNVWLAPSVPPVLPPGHWWLVFYPQMDFAVGGQYGRHLSDTTNPYDAQVINPGSGFGWPTTWARAATQWEITQTDFAFRLSGDVNVMYVSQFRMSYNQPKPGKYVAIGGVQIREMSGPRVPDAVVSAEWTLPDSSVVPGSATTNAQGIATFQVKSTQTGTYTLCVTDVTKAGLTYDPTLNLTTCDTVVVP
jgi:hypothetical protein